MTFISCSNQNQEENKVNSMQIEDITIVEGAEKNIISSSCTVQPLEVYSVKSRVSGEIIKIFFNIGDRVKGNEILAKLDTEFTEREKQKEELVKRGLELEKLKTKLSLKEAEAKYNALLKLEAMGINGKDGNKNRLLNSSEAILKNTLVLTLKQLELKLLESNLRLGDIEEKLSFATIKAPNDGTILERKIEVGTIISSGVSNISGGDVLFEIFDHNKLKLECNVREIDVPLLSLGQKLKVKFKISSEMSFDSEVTAIAPKLEKTGGITSLIFYSELKNIKGIKLKPGMHADVTVYGKNEQIGFILQTNSLGFQDSEIFVYLKRGDGYKKTKISAKRIGANRYVVLDGLKADEKIAKYFVIADDKYSEG